jgi:hypothetical protein
MQWVTLKRFQPSNAYHKSVFIIATVRTKSGTGTGFSPSTSVSSCQHHSNIAPYSSSSICFSYKGIRRRSFRALQKGGGGGVLSEIGEHWKENSFIFFTSNFTKLRAISLPQRTPCTCIFVSCYTKLRVDSTHILFG